MFKEWQQSIEESCNISNTAGPLFRMHHFPDDMGMGERWNFYMLICNVNMEIHVLDIQMVSFYYQMLKCIENCIMCKVIILCWKVCLKQ